MSHLLHTNTVHKTASIADEGNSEYCQFRGAHNINHINLLKLALRGHLNTDSKQWIELGTFCSGEKTSYPLSHRCCLINYKFDERKKNIFIYPNKY